jgi:hypothetical protein
MWLEGGGTNTCPMCREKFGIDAIDNAAIQALPTADKLDAIARKRRARPRPTRYYIRQTFQGALALLEKELPELSHEALLNSIDAELTLSQFAIHMGEHWTEESVGFPIAWPEDLEKQFAGSSADNGSDDGSGGATYDQFDLSKLRQFYAPLVPLGTLDNLRINDATDKEIDEEKEEATEDAIDKATDEANDDTTEDTTDEANGEATDEATDAPIDRVSLRELWTAHRIFGQDHFFLLQLDEAPEVGIWMPFPADIEVVESHKRLLALVGQDHYWERMNSEWPLNLAVPVTTDNLAAHLNALDPPGIAPFDPQLDEIRKIAKARGVSHWWIVDFKRELRFGTVEEYWPRLHAVPWPSKDLVHGYHALHFPTWPRWDAHRGYEEKEREHLSRFVATQLQTPFSRVSLGKADDLIPVPELGKHVYRFSEKMDCWGCLVNEHDDQPLEEWEKYPIIMLADSSENGLLDASAPEDAILSASETKPGSRTWCQEAAIRFDWQGEEDKVTRRSAGWKDDGYESEPGDNESTPEQMIRTMKPLKALRYRSDSLPDPDRLDCEWEWRRW